MDLEHQSDGQKKCRAFTIFVNIHRIRPVVAMTLAETYCALAPRPSAETGMTGDTGSAPRFDIAQYWVDSALRKVLQRGLPGLVGAALLALVHSGAHAQRAEATTPRGWVGETGTASYYGRANQGRRTADGGRFDENALTAAHPWLPFGSKVRVTLRRTGHSVVVTITDRLPSPRRVIDLSLAAARLLGIEHQGVGTVSLSPA
jgi:rare lipoprotein A